MRYTNSLRPAPLFVAPLMVIEEVLHRSTGISNELTEIFGAVLSQIVTGVTLQAEGVDHLALRWVFRSGHHRKNRFAHHFDTVTNIGVEYWLGDVISKLATVFDVV